MTNENNRCIETHRNISDGKLSEMGQYVGYKGKGDEMKGNV